jgi:uncharacterized protein
MAPPGAEQYDADMKPVELVGVHIEVPANTPMMLLQEIDGDRRLLPIYIGHPEAAAIHHALEGLEPPRPMTHDLLLTVMEELGGTLREIAVTEVRDHTFIAELHLDSDDGELVISSRPSDAVALAVRRQVPIVAANELLDEAGQIPEPDDDGTGAAEIIDEFKDFIESVNPDDFAT